MNYHNLLIYSTLDEQFGCYQFGAITNSASPNALYMSLGGRGHKFLSGLHLKLNFWFSGNAIITSDRQLPFPKVVSTSIPTNSVQKFLGYCFVLVNICYI